MAANFGSGGFSYAQAARGHTVAAAQKAPKTPTDVTSPATNGVLSEPLSNSNWADEVAAITETPKSEPPKSQQEEQKIVSPNEAPTDQPKPEEKSSNAVSGISSPDLTATSSTTTKDDDLMSPPNGLSSESTWEDRSQTSEPSWIQEREKRQSGSQATEKAPKSEKKPKASASQPPEKPVSLHEALPPTVNPWLKRAEEAKAKASAQTSPPIPSSSTAVPAGKENRPIQAEFRRKANSVTSLPPANLTDAVNTKKALDGADQQSHNVLRSSPWPNPKIGANATPSEVALPTSTKAKPFERQSLPNSTNSPAIADGASWPTPDSVQDRERRESPEKEAEEARDDDTTPTTKRKKQEWKHLDFTPTFKYETPINEPKGRSRGAPNADRGGKNSATGRGRGGHRGASNTNGGDRQLIRTSSSPAKRGSDPAIDPKGQERGTEGQDEPSKLVRASSAGSWREANLQLPEKGNSLQVSPNGVIASDKQLPNGIKHGAESVNTQAESTPEEGRSESGNKSAIGPSEAPENDIVPEPIPRRNSSGGQTRKVDDFAAENARQSSTLPRHTPVEARKDSRAFEPARDATWNGRGSARKRGRGANTLREHANGHAGSNGLQYVPDVPTYGTPNAAYAAPRGHHQHPYQTAGRAAWATRGGPRSQSIPIESNYYQRLGYPSTGMPPHLSPINTYMPGMYDPSNVPMTAMPYPQQMEAPYLVEMVTTQLDYYFSVDNLLKDIFLRKHMDSQGFVFMDVVANFNRVKQLTQDRDIIKVACMNSQLIQIRIGEDGRERLRNADIWNQFLLPVEDRHESAQNDGPAQLRHPDRPLQMAGVPSHYRGAAPMSAGLSQHPRYDRRSYDSVYPIINGAQAQFGPYGRAPEIVYGDLPNGEEMRGRAAKSPIHETPVSPLGASMDEALDEAEYEPDAFPDSQISVLTVVVNMNQQQAQQSTQQLSQQQRQPWHTLSSRTFSNGSIDSRSIMSEADRSSESSSQAQKDGQTMVNGTEIHLPPVPRRSSPNKPRSNDRAETESNLPVFWVKDQEGPVTNLPSGLTPEQYLQLRLKALDQRNHAATGNCPYDMDVLYQFWCHFLIRNFNNRMYSEFKLCANQDVARHSLVGIQNLLRFYAQSLLSPNPIRDRVVEDYVLLVKNEPPALQGAAFKQLSSAWRNGALNLKNRKKLADIVDEKLKEQLDRLDA